MLRRSKVDELQERMVLTRMLSPSPSKLATSLCDLRAGVIEVKRSSVDTRFASAILEGTDSCPFPGGLPSWLVLQLEPASPATGGFPAPKQHNRLDTMAIFLGTCPTTRGPRPAFASCHHLGLCPQTKLYISYCTNGWSARGLLIVRANNDRIRCFHAQDPAPGLKVLPQSTQCVLGYVLTKAGAGLRTHLLKCIVYFVCCPARAAPCRTPGPCASTSH